VRGVWRAWPEEGLGRVRDVFELCDRRQRGGTVPTVLEVQRELLTGGTLRLAWQRAREAKDAGRADTVLLTHDVTVAAVCEAFTCPDAEYLAGPLWAVPEAWRGAWRVCGTCDPALLEVMGLGEPELRLLDADE
jgi:hypothetical protein